MTKQGKTDILEKGDIYFFYRPRVEKTEVKSFADIEHFYIVMHAIDSKIYRLILVGEKKLPDIDDKSRITWGFVEKVSQKPEGVEDELERKEYETKTRGKRFIEPARPAGEGIYELVNHDDHSHLVYVLELPIQTKEVQQALNIKPQASYVVSVKNPEKPSPPSVGLKEKQEAKYPKELQDLFHNRRFASVDLTNFLNYQGTQILLIGAAEDVYKELGIRLYPQKETEQTAEIYEDLHLEKDIHPVEPLFKGRWR